MRLLATLASSPGMSDRRRGGGAVSGEQWKTRPTADRTIATTGVDLPEFVTAEAPVAVRQLQAPTSDLASHPVRPRRLVLVCSVVGVLLLLSLGIGSWLGGWYGGSSTAGATVEVLGHWEPATRFLLAVALIIAATHTVGGLLRRAGQPAVVGDILAGLMLGPTVLGAVSPSLWSWFFPLEVLTALEMTAQLGLVAFMFLLGSEIRPGRVRRSGSLAATLSVANLGVPFVCTLPVAGLLYEQHRGDNASPAAFGLFLALALSVTALPVLGRILQDRGLVGTPTGSLAITTAVVSDVAAWAMLAVVLAVAGSTAGVEAVLTLILAGLFLALMWWVVRPALALVVRRAEAAAVSRGTLLAIVLGGSIAAAVCTALLGVHAIFGAFLFGALMPRNSAAVERAAGTIRGITLAVLLPLFFASIGIQVSVGVVAASAAGWWSFALILVVAIGAKLIGVTVAARAAGLPIAPASSLGVLMNCRGLTELVIADVGYRTGIIDEYLFVALVLVALITTGLTGPLLRAVGWLARRRSWPVEWGSAAPRPAAEQPPAEQPAAAQPAPTPARRVGAIRNRRNR